MRFVVYEVWTRSRIVEAPSEAEAYDKYAPQPPITDLSLCNWHVVPIDKPSKLELRQTKSST